MGGVERAAKSSESGGRKKSAVPGVGGDITVRQESVEIREAPPPPQGKLWQRLADNEVEVGIHTVKGLAIAVYGGDGYSVHPFICRLDVRAQPGAIRGDSPPQGDPRFRGKRRAKQPHPALPAGQRAPAHIKTG